MEDTKKKSALLIGVQEKPQSKLQWGLLALQHVFAMFGATVLVPLLTGLDSGVALVASGIGTLIYIWATKGKVPVYLGSSFAYIGAISAAAVGTGFDSVYTGLMAVGLIYVFVALIIKYAGKSWIHKLLPPVVIGPMIIIIGLGLAPVAVNSAGFNGGQGWQVPLIAVITFLSVVGFSVFAKGFFKIVPFILAITVGYIFSIIFGIVDFTVFENIHLLQAPNFSFIGTYQLDFQAVLTFAPIAFVTMAEHIGDHTVLGEVCEEDFLQNPGLDKTLIGDGLATFVAAALGGPANTTYGENTGVVSMTKVGSVYVTGLAAIIAIFLGFIGPVQAFIQSIPWAVIGGMTVILYGLISSNGVKVMIKNKVDLYDIRNLVIVATMLVVGLGGAALPLVTDSVTGDVISSLSGMSLAGIVGIILNLFLHVIFKK